MNINKSDVLENCLILGGISISLVDIQTIMSIILLSFNIIWLLVKFSIKLYDKLKDGKLTKEEIQELDEDFNNIKDTINKGGEK